MKIVDCFWEIANIGKKTCEVTLSPAEMINESALQQLCRAYEYVVVKISATNMQNSLLLAKMGFSFAETQIAIQKDLHKQHDVTDSIASFYYKNSCLERINNKEQLEDILKKMSSNMFTTDRIYLDPYFGAEFSLNRYRNWMKTEYSKGTPIYELKYKTNSVGFIMCRKDANVTDALLGGIYENYQNRGLGILLPLVPYMMPDKIDWYRTRISSNNLPVWKMYERLHYAITNFEYIFIKHNEI